MQSDTQNLRQRWIYHRRITTVWQCLYNHDWPHSICLTMEFRGDQTREPQNLHRTHFRTTPDVIAQRGKKFRYDLLINYYHVATLFHISTKYQAHFSQMVNSANHVMFTKLWHCVHRLIFSLPPPFLSRSIIFCRICRGSDSTNPFLYFKRHQVGIRYKRIQRLPTYIVIIFVTL